MHAPPPFSLHSDLCTLLGLDPAATDEADVVTAVAQTARLVRRNRERVAEVAHLEQVYALESHQARGEVKPRRARSLRPQVPSWRPLSWCTRARESLHRLALRSLPTLRALLASTTTRPHDDPGALKNQDPAPQDPRDT